GVGVQTADDDLFDFPPLQLGDLAIRKAVAADLVHDEIALLRRENELALLGARRAGLALENAVEKGVGRIDEARVNAAWEAFRIPGQFLYIGRRRIESALH